jgi:hypothetical protein
VTFWPSGQPQSKSAIGLSDPPPAPRAPGAPTTTLGLSDVSTAFVTPTVNNATVVTNTVTAVAPTITGASASAITDNAANDPFAGVMVADANVGATEVLTVTLSGGAASGTLTGTGVVASTPGVYTVSGNAATVITDIDGAVFHPTNPTNASTVTTLGLSDVSSDFVTPTVNNATVVTNTAAAVAPTITGTHPT